MAKYTKHIGTALSALTLIGIIWASFSFAQEQLSSISSSRSSIAALKDTVEEQKQQIEKLNAVILEVDAANIKVKQLSTTIQINSLQNAMAIQQITLDNVKREKRSLMSKEHYARLERWEHSELLRLKDDEQELEKQIQDQKKQLTTLQGL